MKEITSPCDKIGRVAAFGILCFWVLMVLVSILMLVGSGDIKGASFILVFFLIPLLVITAASRWSNPRIWLGEEGICVKFLFRKHTFHWEQMVQAGILYRPSLRRGFGEGPNYFYILLPGGSPRRYRDWTFPYRNIGKKVRLPNTPEIRDYVIRHYGPLDFDLTDGQSEQSTEID